MAYFPLAFVPAVAGCLSTVPCGRLPTFTTDFELVVIALPFPLTEWLLTSYSLPPYALRVSGLAVPVLNFQRAKENEILVIYSMALLYNRLNITINNIDVK